jgi:hypothetical protein
MTSLIFTSTAGNVTISASVVFGTSFFKRRINQVVQELLSGDLSVSDDGASGNTLLKGLIVLKGVSRSDGEAFESWLTGTILFSKTPFNLAGITGVNLGTGQGSALTLARYDGGVSSEDVLELVPPSQYNINFPYRLVI